MSDDGLLAFVAESNRIEGIDRVRDYEVQAHREFLALESVGVRDLEKFVREVAATVLRCSPGQNVRVGPHVPPPGGPAIESELELLLGQIAKGVLTPWEAHTRYEKLHPFMDGNGRSGRVLWAWHMRDEAWDPFVLPFLHRFYYQTLAASE